MKQETDYTIVYGLSADPLHQQHVDLVVEAAHSLIHQGFEIVKVLIIPVYRRNPVGTKTRGDLAASFEHRFEMCRLGAQEIGQKLRDFGISVDVSGIEQELTRGTIDPNYTVETLQALQAKEKPAMKWILLLGSDLVSGDDPELGHWRQTDKLVQLAAIAIYPRPGYPSNRAFQKDLERQGAIFVHLDVSAQSNINASQIRQRLKDGQNAVLLSQKGLIPEMVALYINEHGIYRILNEG